MQRIKFTTDRLEEVADLQDTCMASRVEGDCGRHLDWSGVQRCL